MKRIPLTQDQFALVDDSDYEWLNLWKWHITKGGRSGLVAYAVRHIYPAPKKLLHERKTIFMHKLIIGVKTDMEVKHKDGNTLNNQRDNLQKGNPKSAAVAIARERRLLVRLKRKFGIPYRLPLQLQTLTPEQIITEWRTFI